MSLNIFLNIEVYLNHVVNFNTFGGVNFKIKAFKKSNKCLKQSILYSIIQKDYPRFA